MEIASAADLCLPAVQGLLEDDACCIVLGCTELSLLATRLTPAAPVIDSLDIIVKSVVRTALRTP